MIVGLPARSQKDRYPLYGFEFQILPVLLALGDPLGAQPKDERVPSIAISLGGSSKNFVLHRRV
jgi:hypothetical protein